MDAGGDSTGWWGSRRRLTAQRRGCAHNDSVALPRVVRHAWCLGVRDLKAHHSLQAASGGTEWCHLPPKVRHGVDCFRGGGSQAGKYRRFAARLCGSRRPGAYAPGLERAALRALGGERAGVRAWWRGRGAAVGDGRVSEIGATPTSAVDSSAPAGAESEGGNGTVTGRYICRQRACAFRAEKAVGGKASWTWRRWRADLRRLVARRSGRSPASLCCASSA